MLVFFCIGLHAFLAYLLTPLRLINLITDRLSHLVAHRTFARSPLAFHYSMSQRSSFSIVFAVFEYTVPFGSDSTANRASFPIDCYSEVLQDGVGMYSGCDVTFVIRK